MEYKIGMFENFKKQLKAVWRARLPLEILQEFEPLNDEYLQQNGGNKIYEEIGYNKIIIDRQTSLKVKIWFILSSIILLFFVFGIVSTGDNYDNEIDIFFIFLIGIISAVLFVISLFRLFLVNKKRVILNREQGIILFNKPIGNKLHTLNMKNVEAGWNSVGGAAPQMVLVLRDKKTKSGIVNPESHVFSNTLHGTLSFYVWYMDKNRPLPPGTAFDPYRQEDFERRKAEGFPKPLYRSHISTPEATPEQQAEREKYWKDHIEEFTREPDSVMYNPEVHTDWRRVRYINKDDSPDSNRYYKYIFENGDIIYMKTNEEGRGFMPPKSAKYTETRLELVESLF